jgi:hypothetical protein
MLLFLQILTYIALKWGIPALRGEGDVKKPFAVEGFFMALFVQ